jgi:hypothetical protein
MMNLNVYVIILNIYISMSKSYGRYKTCGICTGSNTEWYRDRIHKVRNRNKHIIRNIIANNDIEEFDDLYNPYSLPKKDTWMEPTDGSEKYDHKRIKKMMKKYNGWSGGMYITKNNKVKK